MGSAVLVATIPIPTSSHVPFIPMRDGRGRDLVSGLTGTTFPSLHFFPTTAKQARPPRIRTPLNEAKHRPGWSQYEHNYGVPRTCGKKNTSTCTVPRLINHYTGIIQKPRVRTIEASLNSQELFKEIWRCLLLSSNLLSILQGIYPCTCSPH